MPVPILVDPERKSYSLLGMSRGALSTLHPRVVANTLRAARAGFRQTRTQGDALQLGGVLVMRPGGEVAWSRLASAAGDHPPVDEVLAALERVVAEQGTGRG